MAGKPQMHKRLLSPASIEAARARINVGMIQKKLENHIDGTQEMSPTQITAAGILLKKALPDLTSVDLSGSVQSQITFVLDATMRDL